MGCGCRGNGMRNTGSRSVVGPRQNRAGGLRATQAPTPTEAPQISAQNHSVSGMSKKRLELEKKRREAILKKLGRK
jgi:hypothetical protein